MIINNLIFNKLTFNIWLLLSCVVIQNIKKGWLIKIELVFLSWQFTIQGISDKEAVLKHKTIRLRPRVLRAPAYEVRLSQNFR